MTIILREKDARRGSTTKIVHATEIYPKLIHICSVESKTEILQGRVRDLIFSKCIFD